VHIKRVELSHFKSFGGTTQVPLLPGFTVISGPNGSGKSNILDGLLFALGLAGSKGMRAERLPDLVNSSHAGRGRSTVEASVTVTFTLDDEDVTAYLEASENEVDPRLLHSDEAPAQADGTNHAGNGKLAGEAGFRNGTQAQASAMADQTNGSQTNGIGASSQTNGHHASEAPHLAVMREWSITRKLRVTQQGTYTSSYAINNQPCTLTDLHEQLQKFRIYPQGYNVVLQGDVTGIISMNGRERREIIDELAGVAAFDRKINQAKDKLDAVKEREERFRIVEKELTAQRDRLAQDRIKAEKYQKLRADFQKKTQWETVLLWQQQQGKVERLQRQIVADEQAIAECTTQIQTLDGEIQRVSAELDTLNARVKALGDDEHLALQSSLATQEAELRQLQRQEQELAIASQETQSNLTRSQQEIQEHHRSLEALAQEQRHLEQERHHLTEARDAAQRILEERREAANRIAAESDVWVQEQAALRRETETLLQTLDPQRTEQARLQERVEQLQQKVQDLTTSQAAIARSQQETQTQQEQVQRELEQERLHGERLAKLLEQAEQELQVQQETRQRLEQEQRDKQRQLDKLEAQTQAMQEAQGTGAARLILESGMPGLCGLVAQLGRVDPQYQLALEIAAGGRLGQIVVEDDSIAAAGIELLKQRRAGRATFLPLNKIRPPRFTPLSAWERPAGFIDYASNLIDCDDRYRTIFAYVFGSTVVFQDLASARPHLGKFRIVTLEGELLETSGALTGGSLSQRSGSLRFGTVQSGDSAEAIALRERLQVIEQVLGRCEGAIAQASIALKDHSQNLQEARQRYREIQLQTNQLQGQLETLQTQADQHQHQLTQTQEEQATVLARLQTLEQELPALEADLAQKRQRLSELESSQTHSEWQQIQATLRILEADLGDRQLALRTAEQRLQDLETQRQRFQEKISQQEQRLTEYRAQQTQQINQQTSLSQQQTTLQGQIQQTQAAMATLEQTLATARQERDRTERHLREQQNQRQQQDWQRQKLQDSLAERRQTLAALETELATQQAELPDPLPELPDEPPDLTALQHELRSLQKRLQAMEPVNMLALEEYERTQTRLEELSQKLSTLEEERTELLLRIENFTTLRQRAFQEAFDAVNQNFQSIFAELSDGDGHLQLDNPDNPFESGLTLVAHPKGKPVRRLASMSGGEKSLTALSFIFALQRYRPSPFYAFDEVDMFLDGANVERLAKMIKHQAKQAQFVVVSLRRPMIESAERTIGVTQARGAYTQVLGLDLKA
jgi:chromosome segregation protein